MRNNPAGHCSCCARMHSWRSQLSLLLHGCLTLYPVLSEGECPLTGLGSQHSSSAEHMHMPVMLCPGRTALLMCLLWWCLLPCGVCKELLVAVAAYRAVLRGILPLAW